MATYYDGPDLHESVFAALRAAGRDVDKIDSDELAGMDEFHALSRAGTNARVASARHESRYARIPQLRCGSARGEVRAPTNNRTFRAERGSRRVEPGCRSCEKSRSAAMCSAGASSLSRSERSERPTGTASGLGSPGRSRSGSFLNSSDFGALSALEHEQSISDPVARERRFELAGALRQMSPAFEMEWDHGPSSEDVGDVGGVIGGQG